MLLSLGIHVLSICRAFIPAWKFNARYHVVVCLLHVPWSGSAGLDKVARSFSATMSVNFDQPVVECGCRLRIVGVKSVRGSHLRAEQRCVA